MSVGSLPQEVGTINCFFEISKQSVKVSRNLHRIVSYGTCSTRDSAKGSSIVSKYHKNDSTRPVSCQRAIHSRIKRGHTKKKVVHRVDDDLFNQIEVGKTRKLAVAGGVLLDKILVSDGCGELTILVTESLVLLICPATKS